MKKMTPEQRKQMEELMKSMGGNPGKWRPAGGGRRGSGPPAGL